MKIIQTGINGISICCCGGPPPPAGCCDYTGTLKAYVADPCGPYVVNPINLLTATANDLRYAPDEVPKEGTTVWFGTFESGATATPI